MGEGKIVGVYASFLLHPRSMQGEVSVIQNNAISISGQSIAGKNGNARDIENRMDPGSEGTNTNGKEGNRNGFDLKGQMLEKQNRVLKIGYDVRK